MSIQGWLLFEHGANSFRQWRQPSGRYVLFRQCCVLAPRIQYSSDSILGRDPDCYPRTSNNHDRHAVCVRKGTKIVLCI